LVAPAICAVVLMAVLWRRLRSIDASATVPQVEIQLLRSIPIFAALPAPALEGIARELVPMTAPTGTVVIKEGESGDRYYAVADGELIVTQGGVLRQKVTHGQGFGEIALIRNVLRQATVTAASDALLYCLEKELFLETVTGHVSASSVARAVITRHLGEASAP